MAAGILGFTIFHYLAQPPAAPADQGMPAVAPAIYRGIFGALQYVVPLLIGVAAVVSVFGRARRRNLLAQQSGMESIKALSWREFEMLVGEIYRRRGYSVAETESGADGGIDLIARKDGEKFFVQCKHWQKHKVDVLTVREFLGVLYRAGAAGGATSPSRQEWRPPARPWS
jgi:restriction system protein